MKNESCTYILIIADGSRERLKQTLESVLNQTADRASMRVLIIDNASSDGTYHDLLDYEIQYPCLISVIREKRPTTHGRLLKRMESHLRYAEVGNCMILNPGDVICPDLVRNARRLLHLRGEVKCLIYETEIWDGMHMRKQIPVYTENCILSKLCETEYYKSGAGHKVQVIYRGLPLGLSMKLPYYEVAAKCHDWLSLALWRDSSNLYMKECSGHIYEEEKDIKGALIEWAFFVKRNLYAIETQVFSTKNVLDVEEDAVKAAYHCLAEMAVRNAVQKAKKGSFQEAEDALVFAEMMDLDMGEDNAFLQLQQAVLCREYDGNLDVLFEAESRKPPRVCFQF